MNLFHPKSAAMLLTLIIVSILVFAGPADAFILDMTISNDKPAEGEIVTFNVSTEVESADNPSDVDSFILFVVRTNAKDIISCTFFPNGAKITACPGINVVQTSSPTFGYGYGYGYGFGKFSYEITLNTTGLHHGAYRTSFVANVNGKELKEEGKNLVISERKEKEDDHGDEDEGNEENESNHEDDHHENESNHDNKGESDDDKNESNHEDESHGDKNKTKGNHEDEDDNHENTPNGNINVAVVLPPPEEGKVKVCHIPPGNPSNAHTIEIGRSALEAHLAHGDYLGECTEQDIKDHHEDESHHENESSNDKGKNKSNLTETEHENEQHKEDNNQGLSNNKGKGKNR